MPPPKKPTHLRAVEGFPDKRPVNQNEPMPDKGFHPAPDYFTDQEKDWYNDMCRELVKFGVMTLIDSRAVEMMTSAYSEYRSLRECVQADGYTMTTTTMNGEPTVKANPAVAMMSDAWRRFRGMATEFGMTPASRSKVNSTTATNGESAIDDLIGRNRK